MPRQMAAAAYDRLVIDFPGINTTSMMEGNEAREFLETVDLWTGAAENIVNAV